VTSSASDTASDLEGLLKAAIAAINADRQSAAKWDPLYSWFEQRLGVDRKDAAGKLLTENKQLSNRIKKELPQKNPRYVVLCAIGTDFDTEDVMRHLSEANLPNARCAVLLENTKPVRFIIYENDTVVQRLAEILASQVQPEERARPVVGIAAATPAAGAGSGTAFAPVPIVVDERVRRMVLLSIVSTPAVILVGPPGSGKTTLLAEAIDEIRDDPGRFGFTLEVNDPLWATPEESWTTADLLGGQTVDEAGRLRFRPGYVLSTIQQSRWLVLDEANRADMDKIFGGLLTWLGGQAVELGRAATNLQAPSIRLEWNNKPENLTENLDQLSAETPNGAAIRYVAGQEWRLLGTYNALDAQRVFRWGQAIGRRFARVPIPTITAEMFKEALHAYTKDLPDWVSVSVSGLYAAHRQKPATEIGPALFIRMMDYVRAGLASSLSTTEAGAGERITSAEDTIPTIKPRNVERTGPVPVEIPSELESSPAQDERDHPGATETSAPDQRLIAEAYVVHAGTWLARLETTEQEALGRRIVVEHAALAKRDWDWAVELAKVLG
jgi:hypothetical protein